MFHLSSVVGYHLKHLVDKLSKTNKAQTTSEIHKLIDLYGHDVSLLLFRALLEGVHISSEGVGIRDVLKLQLLEEELRKLFEYPSFVSDICLIFEHLPEVSVDRNLLETFGRLLDLTDEEEVLLGLALAQSVNGQIASEALIFLKSKLKTLEISSIKPTHLHQLITFLNMSRDDKDFEDFSSKLGPTSDSVPTFRNQNIYDEAVFLQPMLGQQSEQSVFPPDPKMFQGEWETNQLAKRVGGACLLANFLRDLGSECCAQFEAAKKTLDQFSHGEGCVVDEDAVAKTLVMMGETHSEKQNPNENTQEPQWNVENFVDATRLVKPNLNWTNVLKGLDFPSLNITDQVGLALIVTAYKHATGQLFPPEALLGLWNNPGPQVMLLKLAVNAPPDVITFANLKRRARPLIPGESKFSGEEEAPPPPPVQQPDKPPTGPEAVWGSLDLIETLLNIAKKYPIIRQKVREIFDIGLSQYSELLFIALAMVGDPNRLTSLQLELLSALNATFLLVTSQNASSVVRRVWDINKYAIIHGMSQVYLRDPSSLSRILDVAQDLKTLTEILDKGEPYAFQIDLAALAARREFLNLELWLGDRLKQYRNTFAAACISYLQDKTLRAQTDRIVPAVTLSLETLNVFFKVLHASVSMLSPQNAEELRLLYASCAQANARLATVGHDPPPPPPQGSGGQFSEDIEATANGYFQQIYTEQLGIDETVALLKRFKTSEVQREQDIFACMIHNLFDEYRFFPRYPEKELRITGIIFGSLIQHQLVTYIPLGIALRYVLEALRKPVSSKIFKFGRIALMCFKSRLHEWPQYCAHVLQIPNLHAHHPEIVKMIEQVISEPRTQPPPTAESASANLTPQTQPQSLSSEIVTTPQPETVPVHDLKGTLPPILQAASEQVGKPPMPVVTAVPDIVPKTAADLVHENLPDVIPKNAELPKTVSQPAAPVTNVAPSFATQLPVDTLVKAMPKLKELPTALEDKISFIFNNISTQNLEQKAKDLLKTMESNPDTIPYLAHYIIVMRASIEPNFHQLYIKFLGELSHKDLNKLLDRTCIHNLKVLLHSEKIKTSSSERSLLKNLGSWLGLTTLAVNRAILARDIDLKALLLEAYDVDKLIAIVPFISKILEAAADSKVFQPPNPWVMAIVRLLVEIYELDDVKLNMKFEIESVMRILSLDITDIEPTELLKGRVPAKPVQMAVLPAPTPLSPQRVAQDQVLAQVSEVPQGASTNVVDAEDQKKTDGQVTPSLIASMAQYIRINASLPLFQAHAELKRFATVALDRALRELLTPVVERSVTIACIASRELVSKDFEYEGDEEKMRHAAHSMAQNLAGSLAVVTCKEPLRISMSQHLRTLLTENMPNSQAPENAKMVERAVQVVCAENLDLACTLIEREAMDRGMRDIDESLAPAYQLRQNFKQQGAQGTFHDLTAVSRHGSKFADTLPANLKGRPPGLSLEQLRVYEEFSKISRRGVTQPPSILHTGVAQPQMNETQALQTQPQKLQVSPQVVAATSALPTQEGPSPKIPVVRTDPLTSPEPDTNDAPFPSLQELAAATVSMSSGHQELLRTLIADAQALTAGPSQEPQLQQTTQATPTSSETLTTPQSLERLTPILDSVDEAVSQTVSQAQSTKVAPPQAISDLPSDHPACTALVAIPQILTSVSSRDEAAVAFAQTLFKRLYEHGGAASPVSTLSRSALVSMLSSLRDVYKKISKYLTDWVLYSDNERKFHRLVIVELIRAGLINMSEFDSHLAKAMDNGSNSTVTDFLLHIINTCIINQPVIAPIELQTSISVLQNFASDKKNDDLLHIIAQTKVERPLQTVYQKVGNVDPMVVEAEFFTDVPGFPEECTAVFEEWVQISAQGAMASPKIVASYLSLLQHQGLVILRGEDITAKTHAASTAALTSAKFFRVLIERSVSFCNDVYKTESSKTEGESEDDVDNSRLDALGKLIVVLVFHADPTVTGARAALLSRFLGVLSRVMAQDHTAMQEKFNQKPYFRLIVYLMWELCKRDQILQSSHYQLLATFAGFLHIVQPMRVPGFAFAWLELVSQKMFMSKLLMDPKTKRTQGTPKAWPLFERLFIDLFNFLKPHLRGTKMEETSRCLYKSSLRVLLVLLHDFPEFLCDYHFSLCDALPPTCVQMRNLILSAFPRNMRLPDPFMPNLKVDLLPEIHRNPTILCDVSHALQVAGIKRDLDTFLQVHQPPSLIEDLKTRILLPNSRRAEAGTKYNVPLINSLILYCGMQAAQKMQKSGGALSIVNSPQADVFHLMYDIDPEGRSHFLTAIANQLRYPNSHTHYFSMVLLFLFVDAPAQHREVVREQITRVLLERLIVNRPHPWGLLITFIELIKNPRYRFWSHRFTHCAPEIERLFESVAKSCMGQAATSQQGGEQTEQQGRAPSSTQPAETQLHPSVAQQQQMNVGGPVLRALDGNL